MIIRLRYFHDGLNIELILAPGHEFFSAKKKKKRKFKVIQIPHYFVN